MQEIRLWIKHLSLAQQLTLIVTVSISLFLSFIFFFLSYNINSFVRDEMQSVIQRNQALVIANLENHNPAFNGTEESAIQMVFDDSGDLVYFYNAAYLSREIQAEITAIARQNVELQGTTSDGRMYSLASVRDEYRIVTLVNTSYQNRFRQMLLEIVYLTLIGMIILFIIMIIWVSFIIHPLNQIRLYIDKIRKGEESDLAIDREDEIGELAQALVEMNREIRHQEKLKAEMLQNISHDLKTPIATIKSYGEAIKDGIYPYETLEKSVDVIIENADRMEKKVKSLLMLNRMDYMASEGKEVGTVDMYEVVQKVILSTKQIRKDIEITVNENHVQYQGDEEPWRVALENIIDNALRYAKRKVDINIDQTFLMISDDGQPIDEKLLEHLFRPYEKGLGGQFGLGLSISKRVVNAYGYEISAENHEDGVYFIIAKQTSEKRRRVSRKQA